MGDGKLRPGDGVFYMLGVGPCGGIPRYLAHGPMFAVGRTLSAGLALAQPYIVANAFGTAQVLTPWRMVSTPHFQ